MRSAIALTIAVALGVFAACGDDEAEDSTGSDVTAATEDTTAPEPTDAATTEAPAVSTEPADDTATGNTAMSPLEVVETIDDAAASGDWETFGRLWSTEAVFVFPDGNTIGVWEEAPFPIDDFDGDGVGTAMDISQANVALAGAFGRTVDANCSEETGGAVNCFDVESDVFSRTAGVEDPGLSFRMTCEDGLLMRREFVGPTAGNWAAIDEFDAAVAEEHARYEQWVSDNYPDLHPLMFHGPCCQFELVTTPEAVTHHYDLMPEYQDTLDG